MTLSVALREAVPAVRELTDVLREVGVATFEYHHPDGGSVRLSFLPAAPAAKPSTPEQTGNAGAQALEPPKTTDVFDVIETQRAPGAPGADGLPVVSRAG